MADVVVVTGGSRGIGAATARLAASHGWAVCLSYAQDGAAAEDVAGACRAAGAPAVTAVRADVAAESDVVALFDAASLLGPIRGLVNNAGIVAPQSLVADMTAERMARVFEVNVMGAFLCAREAVRRMTTGGSVVNVSSRAAALGSPGEYVDYAASKAAVDTLTIGLSKEVAAAGIRVNAVRPGIIDTEIHASAGEPGRVQRLAAGIPLGRGGTAAEVAEAIIWLLEDKSSYVTGALVDIGGGR